MSVLTKIVTSVFGKKSDRDMKILTPYIDKINSIYDQLNDLKDDDLKDRFQKIKNDFQGDVTQATKQWMDVNGLTSIQQKRMSKLIQQQQQQLKVLTKNS